MAALMYHINTLQNELDELGSESDEMTISEREQRLDEINHEMDSLWVINIVSISLFWIGITLSIFGKRYKKFRELQKSYLDPPKTRTKLSFIVEENTDTPKLGDDEGNRIGLIGPIKARNIITQNWESIPSVYKFVIGVLDLPFTLIVTFIAFKLIEGFLFDSPLQAIIIMCLVIFISLFTYVYFSELAIIKKYNLKILDQLDY